MIINSRIVQFDTSQLANLARLRESEKSSDRETYERLCESIEKGGWIVALNLHHLSELLQHESDAVVDQRLRYLNSTPHFMVHSTYLNGYILQGVPQLLAEEAVQLVKFPEKRLEDIATGVRQGIWKYVAGSDLVNTYLGGLETYKEEIRQSALKNRAFESIVSTEAISFRDYDLEKMLNAPVRSPNEIALRRPLLTGTLQQALQDRGDVRMESIEEISDEFMSQVIEYGNSIVRRGEHPVLVSLLEFGFKPNDFRKGMTVGDALDIGEFRSKVSIAGPKMLAEQLKFGDMSRCPSWVVEQSIRRHADRRRRVSGSDSTDRNLAAYLAYTDLLFVDRRTYHDLHVAQQATGRMPEPLFSKLERVSSLENTIGVLNSRRS